MSVKEKYFCKRCRRKLPSKICPLHGMEHTELLPTNGPVSAATTVRPGGPNGNANGSATHFTGNGHVQAQPSRPAAHSGNAANGSYTRTEPVTAATRQPVPQAPPANGNGQYPYPAANGNGHYAYPDTPQPATNGHYPKSAPTLQSRQSIVDASDVFRTRFDELDLDDIFSEEKVPTPDPAPVQNAAPNLPHANGNAVSPTPTQAAPKPGATTQVPVSKVASTLPRVKKRSRRSLKSLIEQRFDSLRHKQPREPKAAQRAQAPAPKAQTQPVGPDARTVRDQFLNGKAGTAAAARTQPQPQAAPAQARVATPKAAPRPKAAKAPKVKKPRQPIDRKKWIRVSLAAIVVPGLLVGGVYAFTMIKPKLDMPSINFGQWWQKAVALVGSIESQVSTSPVEAESNPEVAAESAIAASDRAIIEPLLASAREAFESKQILRPAQKNAAGYLEQIFEIAPDYPDAKALQGEIVAFYLERAEQALQEEAFDLAIENYRNILKVSPDNTEVLDQIDVTLKKKNVHAMLNDLDQLAEAKAEVQAEIKELRKEKYKTRAQNQTSRRRRSDAVPDPVADASSSDGISDLGIDLLSKALGGQEEGEAQPNPSPAASSQTSVSKAPKLVEESQIDGGKKAYLHIAVPEVPQSLRSEDLVMVLAECVVGTDGEVESVKLVSPAENDAYNKLAKDALQQYRYKPATFSGMPVRFKAVEVLSF